MLTTSQNLFGIDIHMQEYSFKAPATHEINHCRRKIEMFLIGLFREYQNKKKILTLQPDTCFECALPLELMDIIISYLEPEELINFSMTNKYFYKECSADKLWIKAVKKMLYFINYNLSSFPLKVKDLYLSIKPYIKYCEEIFIRLQRLEDDLYDIYNKRNIKERIDDRNCVEYIFKHKLNIDYSPWKPVKSINIDEEIKGLDIEDFYIIPTDKENVFLLNFSFREGMYQNEDITFTVSLLRETTVHCGRKIHHPYVKENLEFIPDNVDLRSMSLREVIELIYNSFTDISILTNFDDF